MIHPTVQPFGVNKLAPAVRGRVKKCNGEEMNAAVIKRIIETRQVKLHYGANGLVVENRRKNHNRLFKHYFINCS